MIPDFKTFIKESIWSDIQDRSSGDVIRKEDDVNHMNFDTFADYIEDNYSEKGNWFSIAESEDGKSRHIEIDIISEISLSFNVVDGKIYNILVQSSHKYYADVPGLKKIFNVNILGSNTFSVTEKDWTKSNNTFVKLIEFFLEKKTNESIWSDIQDRSSGDVVRKEDDINHLDMDGLLDYINDKYEFENRKPIVISSLIGIPLFSYESDIAYLIISYYNSHNSIYDVYSHLIYDSPLKDSISSMLKQKYSVKILKEHSTSKFDNRAFACISTKPKTGDINNEFVIDVIDTYIDIMDSLKNIDKHIKRK